MRLMIRNAALVSDLQRIAEREGLTVSELARRVLTAYVNGAEARSAE